MFHSRGHKIFNEKTQKLHGKDRTSIQKDAVSPSSHVCYPVQLNASGISRKVRMYVRTPELL